MPLWLILGIAFWLLALITILALCKAAARADRRLGYKVDPSPLAEEVDRWRAAFDRTYERQGIVSDSFTMDHSDRERLGL